MSSKESFALSETVRQLSALVQYGTVMEVNGAQARVRLLSGVETAALPVLQSNTGENKAFMPLSIGEVVLILAPGGAVQSGTILGAIYKPGTEPIKDGHVLEFKDGTKISYDLASKALNITAQGKLELKISGDVSLSTDGAINLKASGDVNLTAKSVVVNGGVGQVVTTTSMCAFTGAPHPIGTPCLKA